MIRLVGVSKEDYVWRAVSSKCARIDILPSDASHPYDREDFNNDTRIYMIGVFSRSVGAEFQLTVRMSDPVKIFSLLLSDMVEFSDPSKYLADRKEKGKNDMLKTAPKSAYHFTHEAIVPGHYQYYSVPLVPSTTTATAISKGDEIVVVISTNSNISSLNGTALVSKLGRKDDISNKYLLETSRGRGVFTADTFSIFGTDGPSLSTTGEDSRSFQNESKDSFPHDYDIPSVLPIVYISQTCKYPSAEEYTWRVITAQLVLKL